MSDPDARSRRILLLGAGHANLLALPILRRELPQARIVLIEPGRQATYSGMFPGYVAGHYRADDLAVDLAAFAARHDVDLIRGRVVGLDPAGRVARVAVEGGERQMVYDVAALDIGSHSGMPGLAGFDAHAVAVKPLGDFVARFAAFSDPDAPDRPVVVIGGGVAGTETALALAHRQRGRVTLIEAGARIVPGVSARTRRRIQAALLRAGITTITADPVTRVLADSVLLQSGARIDSAFTVGIAGARAHGWLVRDLPCDEAGFVTVTPRLQVSGYPSLFAAGDCASMPFAPRPKAGVFAVRQGPVMARNMAAFLRGDALTDYCPQRDYLKIISLGRRIAVAEWYGLTLHGRWLWRWKDRIDRSFMARFKG